MPRMRFRSVRAIAISTVAVLLAWVGAHFIPYLDEIVTDWDQQFCAGGRSVSIRANTLKKELTELRRWAKQLEHIPRGLLPRDPPSLVATLEKMGPNRSWYGAFKFTRTGIDPWGRALRYKITPLGDTSLDGPRLFEILIWSDGVNGRNENANGDDVQARLDWYWE